MPKADLVLEGGGVKGLGLVGAVLQLMREGYTFPRVAGTSAGSMLAAFLAAGATVDQLAQIMERLDYSRVPDRSAPGVPGLSEGIGCCTGGAHTRAITLIASSPRSLSGSASRRSLICAARIARRTRTWRRIRPSSSS